MRDWEKGLPPIARERLARIGKISPEEKDKIIDSEKADSLLSEFYEGQLDPESLWQRLKEEGKPSLLRQVQVKLVDSLSLGTTPAELERRRQGILALESLKEEQNTSTVELSLNLLADLPQRYKAEIEQAYKNVKAEVERNPQLRLKQIQQGQSTVVIQLSVDEAIQQLPQWKNFLSDRERRYRQEFAKVVERLIRELK